MEKNEFSSRWRDDEPKNSKLWRNIISFGAVFFVLVAVLLFTVDPLKNSFPESSVSVPEFGFGYLKGMEIEVFDEIIEDQLDKIIFIKVGDILYHVAKNAIPLQNRILPWNFDELLDSFYFHGANYPFLTFNGAPGRLPSADMYKYSEEIVEEFNKRILLLQDADIAGAAEWGGEAWCIEKTLSNTGELMEDGEDNIFVTVFFMEDGTFRTIKGYGSHPNYRFVITFNTPQ